MKHAIELKVEGRIEMMGKRGRRRKRLLGELKEKRGYCKLKCGALDRTSCRPCFGIRYGPVETRSTGC
jgi:hypothetical protein